MNQRFALKSSAVWHVMSFAAVLLCGLLYGPAASAADAPAAKAAPDELAAKRAKLSEQMTKLAQIEEAQGATAEQTPAAEEAEEELDLLRTLDLLYLQHQATVEQRVDIENQKRSAQDELNALQTFGPPEAKPYSFLLLEDVRDQLAAEESRQKVTDSDLTSAEQLLEAAREQFDEAEQQRRLAHEELDNNSDDEEQAKLEREFTLAELNSSIGQETVALRRAEIEVKTARLEACKLRQTLLTEKIELISKDVKFTERDLKARLASLARYSQELKRKLKESEARLRKLDAEQVRTQAELLPQADKSLLAAAGAAFAMARRVSQEEISILNQRLGEVERFGHYWEGRFECASETDNEELEDWRRGLARFLDRVEQAEHSLAARIDEIRVDQATLLGRSQDAAGPEQQKWTEFQAEQLARLADLCETCLLHLKASQRSAERFREDLDARIEPERRADWFGPAREMFVAFWNYELASVDDRPITVGKIIGAITYLLIGLLAARIISRVLGRRVLPRFGLNEGAAHAVQTISFYALSVLFGLLSLELVNLPFAAFTFLGGAAAIGIGFGSQNILNNFISGLILLAEQPIRVGDLVEIDGVQGIVEHIGARSTRVKTASNHEIVVPNSKLLENKVTNLTLTDDLVQTAIGVSLSPSMTVDEVRHSLLSCAASHRKVISDPAPVVLFKEFSPTAMKFELHFWLKLHDTMECRIVESEVREKINDLFAHTDVATTTPAAPSIVRPDTAIAGKLPLREAA